MVAEGLILGDLTLRNVLVFAFHPSDSRSVLVKVTHRTKLGKKQTAIAPTRRTPPEATDEHFHWTEKVSTRGLRSNQL